MRTLRKCKIDFNKSLVLTINNLLKPLLSKPETKLIQTKYETIHMLHEKEAVEGPNEKKPFFESHNTYVVTYEAAYVSTKIEL